ncbi:MAG: hypothetical protein QOF78_639 [Phycisphaerales bacterium]|jgi:multisubunit Na+/H+ antiporter MnhB subunit|nr:hypothetical protein [Phycisphaerales bacterium]
MNPAQLDYQSPSADRTPASIKHAVAGTFAALAAGPGLVFGATWIAGVMSNEPYGALSGLVIGGIIAVLLMLAALVTGIVQSRSPNGRRRGFAIGLMIGSGLSLLAAGACFVGIR